MPTKYSFLVPTIFSLLLFNPVEAQTVPAKGSLEVSGRVKIDGKVEKLTRKRFYLFSGGLKENAALVDRIKAAETISRDCYYTQAKASQSFICWLKAADCESPYCRTPSETEVQAVPEFKAAFAKGTTQFRAKTAVARDWLFVNMQPSLVNGFYLQKRNLTEKLLANVKPVQSSMTDTVTVKSIFIDIPLSAVAARFTVSNVLPIEIGKKSYVWACEISIEPGKTAKLNLQIPEAGKTIRNCEVVVKDLQQCGTGACEQK